MVWWLLVFQVCCVNTLLLQHLQWRMTSELCFVYSLAWKQDSVCFQRWLMRSSYFAYNGWQMRWPAPGWRGRLGVCLHRLISQTKRVLRATSCAGSDQTAGRSCREGPLSTWQNKMGPQCDSEDNISANKWTVYGDGASEMLRCVSHRDRDERKSGM